MVHAIGGPDHVTRYCKPRSVVPRGSLALDEILPEAFEFMQGPDGLESSINWLEFLSHNHAMAMVEVLKAVRGKLTLRANGRFAVLNVGRIRAIDLPDGSHLDVVHRPECNDPSHAGIFGTMTDTLQVAADLAALARNEGVLHPAVV